MLDRRAMLGGTGLLAFPAQAWSTDKRRIINAMMTDEPAHLNYPLFNTRIMQEICGNINESLLLFDWQFKPHPNLARAFEMSPDGLTYTFHLRTDVQWHDGAKFTAAHKTLPVGTRLRVTDTRTKRSVVVVVNDRGPFTPGRVIDLSLAAATSLGMIARGVIPVNVEHIAE